MKLENLPGFRKLDLVEIFYSDGICGRESETGYAISGGKEGNVGGYLEFSKRVASGLPVSPKKILLRHVERVVVYRRKRQQV